MSSSLKHRIHGPGPRSGRLMVGPVKLGTPPLGSLAGLMQSYAFLSVEISKIFI